MAGAVLAAADGVAERVTAVALSPGELEVRRALVPDQRAPWAGVIELRPPSTPLSRWRIRSAAGAISLMPSDLFGGEDALGEIVRRSELEFRDGRWQRSPEPVERPPGERRAG